MTLRLRELSEEEAQTIEHLVHARSTPVGKLKRAQIIWLASQGQLTPEIAKQLKISERMVRTRLHRFNEQGVQGWEEAPRSGRPATSTPEEVGSIIQTALSKPRDVGEDYAIWTLDRLVEHLHRVKGIRMQRSRISEIFIAEGLKPGDMRRAGLASGSIPTSRKKGGHRNPLHQPPSQQRSRLSRSNGSCSRQKLPGQAAGACPSHCLHTSRAGQARD